MSITPISVQLSTDVASSSLGAGATVNLVGDRWIGYITVEANSVQIKGLETDGSTYERLEDLIANFITFSSDDPMLFNGTLGRYMRLHNTSAGALNYLYTWGEIT
jgi:hypothetical protein